MPGWSLLIQGAKEKALGDHIISFEVLAGKTVAFAEPPAAVKVQRQALFDFMMFSQFRYDWRRRYNNREAVELIEKSCFRVSTIRLSGTLMLLNNIKGIRPDATRKKSRKRFDGYNARYY